ncbi:hypothetical protein BDV18DRAFT_129227 [Aspergillus unguis]
MAEFRTVPKRGGFADPHRPYWACSQVKYAQDLLEYSTDPIEYDHDDKDAWDNAFFFPEDCCWSPPKDWDLDDDNSSIEDIAVGECYELDTTDTMIPGLPDIKMLDAEALSDLLEDNLSPPEITSMFVFATNGAIFAYASPLPSRQLRNLSATYGAAYTCYAKTASSGNLTGVNPASHPSSYVTAQSVSLGDVGSIVFELDDSVAVVTKIADKVLLAAVGPAKVADTAVENAPAGLDLGTAESGTPPAAEPSQVSADGTPSSTTQLQQAPNGTPQASPSTNTNTNDASGPTSKPKHKKGPTSAPANTTYMSEAHLQSQYEVDRSRDLERLASLNLSTPPSILLALEAKSAALGRFLAQKLEDLESPDDF